MTIKNESLSILTLIDGLFANYWVREYKSRCFLKKSGKITRLID
jgi:hypothetical protein